MQSKTNLCGEKVATRRTRFKQVDEFIVSLDRELGHGSYGSVYEGIDTKKQNTKVAIKQISLTLRNSEAETLVSILKSEIGALKTIRDHTNIVELLDVRRSSNHIYLIFSFCNGGNLENYLNTHPSQISESESLHIIGQIIAAFSCLHQQNIVHRDLKLANILLHDGVIKVADFGFSKLIKHNMTEQFMHSQVGSPIYMSPQLFNEQKYSSKLDVWSLGVIFFELIFKNPPWNGKSEYDLKQNINNLPLRIPEMPKISRESQQLLKSMLEKDEEKRISWQNLFTLFLDLKGRPKKLREKILIMN